MNDEQMKERLSALADDELSELEERQVFAALKSDATLRRTWERYHVARSALRGDLKTLAPRDAAERIAARLETESSPSTSQKRKLTNLVGTLAIAASVAAVAIVGVQWLQQPEAVSPSPVANAPTNFVRSGTTRWDMKEPETESALNAYLVEHDEFASTSGIGGMIPYVRVVTYDNDK